MSNVVASTRMDHGVAVGALVAAFIAAAGIVFLVTMYVLLAWRKQQEALVFGALNDVCVAVQYVLSIPLALSIRRRLEVDAPGSMRWPTLLGMCGMLLAAGLQVALVAGWIPFHIQVFLVAFPMLVLIGGWIWLVDRQGGATGHLRLGRALTWWSIFYFGYPWFLARMAAWLRTPNPSSPSGT